MNIFRKVLMASLLIVSQLHANQTIELSHAKRLESLKDKGFEPKVIYDIGAYKGNWALEVEKVFPNARFILFEANENQRPFLSKLPFSFFIAALGDREDSVSFFSNDSTGDSLLKENTQFYDKGRCCEKKVQMTTLANLIKKNDLPLPNLIKLDVQGAEKLIIKGSPSVIKHAEVVILETKILEYNENAPLIFDIMQTMHELGFRVLDILEMHYLPSGELNEIDLLFVKENSSLIKKGKLI
jgi:FkbM family methyltransferase